MIFLYLKSPMLPLCPRIQLLLGYSCSWGMRLRMPFMCGPPYILIAPAAAKSLQ